VASKGTAEGGEFFTGSLTSKTPVRRGGA